MMGYIGIIGYIRVHIGPSARIHPPDVIGKYAPDSVIGKASPEKLQGFRI